MCLSAPGRIVRIENNTAVVDYGREQRSAAIVADGFCIGDYVIIVGRVVVQKVPEEQAKEALRFYNEAVATG